MLNEPIFYQHITKKAFSALIKHKFDVHESVEEETSIPTTNLTKKKMPSGTYSDLYPPKIPKRRIRSYKKQSMI